MQRNDDLTRVRDRKLAARMCAGDERAIRDFCREYLPRVYRFALARVAIASDADDVVQTVMMNAARRIETFRGESTLFGWLLTICRHELAKRRAHDGVARAAPVRDEDSLRALVESIEAPPGDEPERLALADELRRRVRMAMAELPDRYADVLELKYVEDMSSKEIAERLSISDEAVQSLLARARNALRTFCRTAVWADLGEEHMNGAAD